MTGGENSSVNIHKWRLLQKAGLTHRFYTTSRDTTPVSTMWVVSLTVWTARGMMRPPSGRSEYMFVGGLIFCRKRILTRCRRPCPGCRRIRCQVDDQRRF